MSALYEYVGNGGTGTFTQTGGTNNVQTGLYVGQGGSGTYISQGGGQLSVTNEVRAFTGTGTFTQSGGINMVGFSFDKFIGGKLQSQWRAN